MIGGGLTRSEESTWNKKFWEGEDTFEEEATVPKVLQWVWGTIFYSEKEKKYKFSGTLRENVLVATHKVKRQRFTLDRRAYMFVVNSLGVLLKREGKYS